jgi:hypothetical protein
LHGHTASAADFREPWQPDPAVCAAAGKVEIAVGPEMGFASARLTLDYADGQRAVAEVPVAKGHPGNPMGWDEMRAKFDALATPVLGPRGEALFALARDFGRAGTPCRSIKPCRHSGAPRRGEPGIHVPETRDYGFRVRPTAAPE